MSQLGLLEAPAPRIPPGIDYGCGTNADAIARVGDGEAALVIADPAWGEYSGVAGPAGKEANPADVYPVESLETIRATLAATARCVRDGRLAVWHCWPLLVEEIRDASKRPPLVGAPWRLVTGGAWTKSPHVGVGHHWLGRSEPVLVYVRGTPTTNRDEIVGNAFVSMPGEHSAKPEAWHEGWIRRWTSPGDLVLDLWPGLGGVARACARTGRRYVGREIDPARARIGAGLIAGDRVAA